jgi:hypothetical protein
MLKNRTFQMLVVIALIGIALVSTISAGQSATQNLTALSTTDIAAYRWEAMAKFYAAQGSQIPVTGGNLTTLSANDISAYRWNAIGRFYAAQASAVDLSWPDFWHFKEENVALASYRSQLGECFDVPVSELAQCRAESETSSK